ncbi:hypothetical protein EUX98_g6504 [Antrodiella citrinella]|uniref:NAD(P)-binding protein n=1 Tax=Antrodiella citrinella TaxID=2447956 RepID=A0A4S4MPM4_9APHY|nr:hypothetical protein EUX98_g6504 [Antrodiella citrinella]
MKENKPVPFLASRDIPDLSGKAIFATGGNSGLGYETVKQLYAHNAKVYLACRNEAKGKDAIARMKAELQAEGYGGGSKEKHGSVIWLKLDLCDPRKVMQVAEDFMKMEERPDVLVNNAGVTSGSYVIRPETCNIQQAIMVNHLSPFVFTLTLLPLLIKTSQELSADVRIVNVSSSSVKSPTFEPGWLRFRNKDDFNDRHKDGRAPMRARYGVTKVANALFTLALQTRFERDGVPILAAAVDPGFVDTEGIRNVSIPSVHKAFRTIYKLVVIAFTASKEASAQLFASTSLKDWRMSERAGV